MKEAIIIGVPFFLLCLACVCNYMRASRLEEKINDLERRQYFTRTDLSDLIKNVQKLVDILVSKNGTTQDH